MQSYEKLIERISESAKLPVAELEQKIDAKRTKLSGLISKEGAAQIVAAELGISFDNQKLEISELAQGMKNASVVGKITRMFPVREYSKNGKEGKIGSFLLGDNSANIRVVLWDMNHISLIEKEELQEGDSVEIMNGNVRNGELHLSGFSDIKPSKETFENVQTARVASEGVLKDAQAGLSMKTRAVIVQTFEPRYFESKKNPGEKGVLLNIVLDDGTETMRSVLFGEAIKKLGFTDDELFAIEAFNAKRATLLGEERLFSGTFRTNTFFNNIEMTIEGVEEVDIDSLIQALEAKA